LVQEYFLTGHRIPPKSFGSLAVNLNVLVLTMR